MILTSATANAMVFLSNFNLLAYLLYLRQRKEMEMACLANANEHFNKTTGWQVGFGISCSICSSIIVSQAFIYV